MSVESDAASQVASIYTTGIKETANIAIKVMGEVFQISKELAKLLFTKGIYQGLIKQEGKQAGLLKLDNLLRKSADKGFTINVLEVKNKEEFKTLSKELEKNGVMFAKSNDKDSYNIIFTEDYAPIVNRVIEKNNLNSVEKVAESKVEHETEPDIDVNTDEVTIDDDYQEVQSTDNFADNYEGKSKVDLNKDNESKETADLEVKEQPNPYTDGNHYNDNLPFDEEKVGEEVDIDELEKSFGDKEKSNSEVPLVKDGERAAPSETKSNNGKSKGNSQSINNKLSQKKEQFSKAKESADKVKDISDSVKKSAKGVKDTFGGK